MIPAINATLLAIGNSVAASIVAKATLVLAFGLIAVRVSQGSRAAVRHALLAAVFAVLLALPVAALLAPPVRIAVAAPPQVVPASTPAALRAHGAATAAAPAPSFSPPTLLFTAWIAGTLLFLLPVPIGLWQVRRLRRSALPWLQAQSAVESLALECGIGRRVAVLLHESLPGPMTCGVLDAAIVLPQDAPAWSAADLNRALLHELEHVRRRDSLTHCLARAICAAWWFHPLVWIAWRRLTVEAERACDDAVLRRSEATAYADQLVGLAQKLSLSAKVPFLAMASRADLAARVGAVLDSRQSRGRAGKLAVALACTAAAVLVLTISPLTVVRMAKAAPPQADAERLPRLAASTMLVSVQVTVTDPYGRSVEGLSAADFAVTEDGTPQTISVFEFQSAAAPVSSYYLLGYYTMNARQDGGFRQIAVTLKNDSTSRLTYRPGYYAPLADRGPAPGRAGAAPDPSVTYPVIIFKKNPAYSDEARKAKFQGTVLLTAEIDPSGRVSSVRVVRSLGLNLDEHALDAVKQWRFRPATKNGSPITMPVEVEVSFRLM